MARPRKKTTRNVAKTLVNEMVTKPEPVSLDQMPLENLYDYRAYNAEARRINKKLGVYRHPIKQCPVELHDKEKVVFGRVDQPTNPIKAYLSNEDIEYKKELVPGKEYLMPTVVVNFLTSKGSPNWQRFDNPDGSCETRKVSTSPRFTIRSVYA